MNPTFSSAVLLAAFVAAASSALPARTSPGRAQLHAGSRPLTSPAARRSDQVDNYHGVEVADPYRWMEEISSEDTRAWIAAKDRQARGFFATWPHRARVRSLIAPLGRAMVVTPPVEAGGNYFYTRFEPTGANPVYAQILVRRGLTAEPRLLIDGAALLARSGLEIKRVAPSPDGRYVLYGVTEKGGEWENVRVRNLATGRDTSDVLTGIHRLSGVTWARQSGSGFYYTRLEPPAAGHESQGGLKGGAVYFHRLGRPQSEDELVYEGPGQSAGWRASPQVSDDGRFLIITDRQGAGLGNNSRILYRRLDRPGAPVVPLIPEGDAAFRYVGNAGDTFWIETRLGAPNGRVVAVPLARPSRAGWRDLIPEGKHPFDTWAGGAFAAGGYIVTLHRADARLDASVFDTRGKLRYRLGLPYTYPSIWSGIVGRHQTPEAFFSVQGLADRGSVYRLETRTGKLSVFERSVVPFDLDALVSEQVFVTSSDGTRVPMLVIRHRETKVDGTAPGIVYGYGAGAWTASPWFQPGFAQWVYMGGVWALPGLRGGGEYGERWTEAGRRRNKQNAINDFTTAAEWLVANKYVAPKKVVANASSMGGVIAAAAVVQRPELFGAAVLDYPVIDMLRFEHFTAGRRWVGEYGSPGDAEDFKALRAYSPIHNALPGTCYPPTLASPGENDHTAAPMHAYKFIATLQWANAATSGCASPALLRVSWGAGHAAGKTAEDSLDTWADQLAFLCLVLDFKPRLLR